MKQDPVVTSELLMGNEAIARGALEAGVNFAAGYPGTPSSEIIHTIIEAARGRNIHVEWSTNEKVAMEGAAAASFAGLRSIAAMKNAGLSVALDFLTHLSLTGLGDRGGAMVAVVCDDPDAHSSGDETDSRWLARFSYTPLLEPSSVQEAKQLVKWAFELSKRYRCAVMVRSYTRLSHASSTVELDQIPEGRPTAETDGSRSITPYLARPKHAEVIEKLAEIRKCFEASPFNSYEGPEDPEILIVCSGGGHPCSAEAVEMMGRSGSVGILKVATLWPFPGAMISKRLKTVERILVVEEVDPFLEIHVKEMIVDFGLEGKRVFGKGSGHIPGFGEITPDRVMKALSDLLQQAPPQRPSSYERLLSKSADPILIGRGLTWCPGCPHRASFWALEKAIKADVREAYVTGDIGCYTLDVFPEGKGQMKLLHAMGSGTGLAAGFGQLRRFDYQNPVIAICGDSTFFHASIPALINAVYNGSDMLQIILDNSATAMTGFQSHPGTGFNALGEPARRIDIEKLCRAIGCKVEVQDPFDIRGTSRRIRELLRMKKGVRVLVLRRSCELVRMRKERKRPYSIRIDKEKCRGERCGICSSAFRCPSLIQEPSTGYASLVDETCAGCGVCEQICPFNAIEKETNA